MERALKEVPLGESEIRGKRGPFAATWLDYIKVNNPRIALRFIRACILLQHP
jgi:hypothetical protein